MLSQQYGHSEAYTYKICHIGNMITDQYLVIFRERISLIPIHLNKISCSDRPAVVGLHSHMKGDLRLNQYYYNINEQSSVTWLQTSCVIYLPVVVNGATRLTSRGLPANTTHPPSAATMLCQRRRRWTNIVPRLTVQCCLNVGPALSMVS